MSRFISMPVFGVFWEVSIYSPYGVSYLQWTPQNNCWHITCHIHNEYNYSSISSSVPIASLSSAAAAGAGNKIISLAPPISYNTHTTLLYTGFVECYPKSTCKRACLMSYKSIIAITFLCFYICYSENSLGIKSFTVNLVFCAGDLSPMMRPGRCDSWAVLAHQLTQIRG